MNYKSQELANIRGLKVGANSQIHNTTMLAPKNGYIIIGKNVYINDGCIFFGEGGINIGDDTMFGPGVVISGSNHGLSKNKKIRLQKVKFTEITVGKDCWVGANCTLVPGAIMNDGSVLGGGSLLNKEIPEYEIWAGNPAKKIGERE